LRDDSGEVAETLEVVVVDEGIRVLEGCLGTALNANDTYLRVNGLHGNNWLLNHVSMSRNSSIDVLISTLNILSGLSLLIVTSIILLEVVLVSILIEVALILVWHANIHLLLHQEQNLLNKQDSLRLLKNIHVNLI
jgi:hypothetical protein